MLRVVLSLTSLITLAGCDFFRELPPCDHSWLVVWQIIEDPTFISYDEAYLPDASRQIGEHVRLQISLPDGSFTLSIDDLRLPSQEVLYTHPGQPTQRGTFSGFCEETLDPSNRTLDCAITGEDASTGLAGTITLIEEESCPID